MGDSDQRSHRQSDQLEQATRQVEELRAASIKQARGRQRVAELLVASASLVAGVAIAIGSREELSHAVGLIAPAVSFVGLAVGVATSRVADWILESGPIVLRLSKPTVVAGAAGEVDELSERWRALQETRERSWAALVEARNDPTIVVSSEGAPFL